MHSLFVFMAMLPTYLVFKSEIMIVFCCWVIEWNGRILFACARSRLVGGMFCTSWFLHLQGFGRKFSLADTG